MEYSDGAEDDGETRGVEGTRGVEEDDETLGVEDGTGDIRGEVGEEGEDNGDSVGDIGDKGDIDGELGEDKGLVEEGLRELMKDWEGCCWLRKVRLILLYATGSGIAGEKEFIGLTGQTFMTGLTIWGFVVFIVLLLLKTKLDDWSLFTLFGLILGAKLLKSILINPKLLRLMLLVLVVLFA